MKKTFLMLWLLGIICCAGLSSLGAQTQQCAPESVTSINLKLPVPTLKKVKEGDDKIHGMVDKPDEAAKVLVCILDKAGYQRYRGLALTNADGAFVLQLKPEEKLQDGEKVFVQTVKPNEKSPSLLDYGRYSEKPLKVVASCEYQELQHSAKNASDGKDSAPPKRIQANLKFDRDEKDVNISGSAKELAKKKLRVCKNDEPQSQTGETTASENGDFKFPLLDIADGDSISVQVVDGDQLISVSKSVDPQEADDDDYRGARYVLVGGFENFWYASEGNKVDPFVQLFLEGPEHCRDVKTNFCFAPWGNVRLLGTPKASTNGVGSNFTDPTGLVKKQDFATVGTSVDWQAGLEEFLTEPGHDWGRFGLIASFGGTNPLSSQDAPIIFKTPAQGTNECAEILSRFTANKGYPTLTPGDAKTVSCLQSAGIAVTHIAFTNQDRSSTLFKWNAGIRADGSLNCTKTYAECSDSFGLLDLTIGQDAAMTRGMLRNFVMKVDGTFPIKTGAASFLYLYGSAYWRLKHNIDLLPLTLATDPQAPTLPNPAVVNLPLKQPDRDFFRVGLGINLGQVFCKLSVGPCTDDTKK